MRTNSFKFIIMAAMLLSLGACSEDSATDPTQITPGTLASNINIFEASKEIAPSFDETAVKTEWDPDDPMEALFNGFRMFDPEIHQGIIDGSNFFRALYDMNENLEMMLEVAEAIDPVVIQEPYEFGNSVVYDHAANTYEEESGRTYTDGYAYRIDGDVIHYLVTYRVTENEGLQSTLGQLQGSYNSVSGDLDLAYIYLVEYSDGVYYGVRNEITGNELTHEFELRMVNYDSHGGVTSMAGKGLSQGEDAFFLVKMDYGYGEDPYGERYYVFPSTADEAFLQAMDRTGLQYEELPVEVADFQADVNDLVLFVTEDLPTSHTDFNDSDITLAF